MRLSPTFAPWSMPQEASSAHVLQSRKVKEIPDSLRVDKNWITTLAVIVNEELECI